MSFSSPKFSRGDVNRAGAILASDSATPQDADWATQVLANWRAAHLYPINTFQATLRSRVGKVDSNAIVAQRLKRTPSVVAKLRRFTTMDLSQMQDIGGLRAVVSSVAKVRKLAAIYQTPGALKHTLVNAKDYISKPKADGYRGIHLVFRYRNDAVPQYNNLHIELQIRTKMQHAWATAVETMGTFVGQALKAGQGDDRWRRFFAIASAAIAHHERTPAVPNYNELSWFETYELLAKTESELSVLAKLQSFAVATQAITSTPEKGKYHLVVLDAGKRSVQLTAFSEKRLDFANEAYAAVEKRGLSGEQVEAVLVSAGPVDALKKAYPNYFLDTHIFIGHIQRIIRIATHPAGNPEAYWPPERDRE